MMRIPRELAASRWERGTEHADLAIETTVTLAPGDALIRFRTRVENTALDHRLRVHMVAPFAADHAHAEDAFAMVRRAARPDTSGDWAEQPVGTAPHQGVVAMHGNGASLVLAARGLPEYEILERSSDTSELALTLLRSTGWLSRSDLAVRRGDAGPSVPTPEAQCIGLQTFEYAVTFGATAWRELLPAARAFAVPPRVSVGPCAEGTLPATAALVGARPPAIVVSALKGAEDGRGAICRVYNDDTIAHEAELFWCLPVQRATRVNLAETDEAVLFEGEQRDGIRVEVPAGRIVSLRLEWA
jgi:alpha-mannosidase